MLLTSANSARDEHAAIGQEGRSMKVSTGVKRAGRAPGSRAGIEYLGRFGGEPIATAAANDQHLSVRNQSSCVTRTPSRHGFRRIPPSCRTVVDFGARRGR